MRRIWTDPPIALSAAGTTKCLDSSAATSASQRSHLRKALSYAPNSIISHLFLAETLIELGRSDEARKELEAALAAPISADWAPEDRRFKQQAKTLLSKTPAMTLQRVSATRYGATKSTKSRRKLLRQTSLVFFVTFVATFSLRF